MRDSEANAFTRSRGEMHPFWISMHERGHLTACFSHQRSRYLAIDMLHAVRIAKRGGHRVHDDGSHTRIDGGRRVVIKIDGGRVGQLHVWCFLVYSPVWRDTLYALGHVHREAQAITPEGRHPVLASLHTSGTR